MSTVTDFAPAPAVAAEFEPSRRRLPPGGAGTSNPAPSSVPVRNAVRTSSPILTSSFKAAARRTVSAFTTALFVVAVAAFLLLAVGPRVLGYQTSTMLTGSMAPQINPGDVVVTVPTPVADIRVGDIITYHIPVEDQRVETHRVTEILTTEDGTTAVRTKGDANNGADPWTATVQGSTVDRHVLTVPYVGQAIRALREPVVRNTLMYGAPAVLVIGLLASIWRKDPEPAASE
ncbi:signal peptidase I [Arthrobacter sp. ISL-48]|uniref:signal peptidase I n=1 Tax=Arthrobacter sp. ISL-48 TaxID=2819110 RepID=UPI001BE8E052|nr:signal peptidase I [Arthrobacter sp. ISL-48]MBT2534290.1 signal peptidase I [Arthrobacter sp. ISL-48]